MPIFAHEHDQSPTIYHFMPLHTTIITLSPQMPRIYFNKTSLSCHNLLTNFYHLA
ncbi:hypothetical protein HOLDEFILI_01697 [Holdemania filiformis DSM 12042]|uniref:Uncharacterized protein n=1 Tax=Holdemania filiformis DSM 12042 TaxID=545696 RepID=B9Y7A1_9FIRM|nr:hypothetical protein HOLDEFILI_01697 [Holdemania filiformis DSM 12042]